MPSPWLVWFLQWSLKVCWLSSSLAWVAARCMLVCQPLPGGCWCYSGCFLVFGRAGILGSLVSVYALLWFRLFMMGFMSPRSLFLVFVYVFSICRLHSTMV
jgi:hypothetical protein